MKVIAKLDLAEACSGAGIVVGVGMLLAGIVSGDLGALAIPALVVLVPSLLHGMR